MDSAETEVNATQQGELAERVFKALKRGCLLIPPSKLSYSFAELYRQRDSGKCSLGEGGLVVQDAMLWSALNYFLDS